MNDQPNLHHPNPSIPPADVRAVRLAAESGAWLDFAQERSRMTAPVVRRKAFGACAFSVARSARSLAVPSKLAGTKQYQRRLWAMVRELASAWSELALDASGDGLTALYDGEPVGEVQPKHLPWLRPLVPYGVRLYLGAVTGSQRDHATLGCNVVVGHVGSALGELLAAPDAGAGHGGNGGSETDAEHAPSPAVAVSGGMQQAPGHALVEATHPSLRLVALPQREALSGDADDVILWRRIDGSAHASVTHAVRHSRSGIEWGYGGSGPADLARSVLLALTDKATAEALYQVFKAEVVAGIDYAGGVLRAAEVRAWCATRADRLPAA